MPDASGARILRRITANWPLKLTALALAAVLWAAVAADEPSSQRVAIALRVNAPEGRPLTRSLPTVYGIFGGPARELLKLYASPPVFRISIPDTAVDSVYTVHVATRDIEIPKHIEVKTESVDPGTITLTLENVGRRTVPVVPRVTIKPDSGFAMFGGIAVTPDSILLIGPGARLTQIREVSTLPIELSGVSGPIHRAVQLDTSGMGPVRLTRSDVEISTVVGPVSERVLMGVPVTVRGDRGGWSSEPPAVIVTVRGPMARLVRLTRDSVEVAALPDGSGRAETVKLEVVAPPGVEATAMPDTAVVQRRNRG
jgi:hypothetical protein